MPRHRAPPWRRPRRSRRVTAPTGRPAASPSTGPTADSFAAWERAYRDSYRIPTSKASSRTPAMTSRDARPGGCMSDATARRPRLRLMTVHAHPDDETISTGGVYLRCADAGIPTILVCCTNGEEGEIVDPELNNDDVRARLGEVRRQELACAAAILRVSTVEYLGYRDSGMARTSSNEHPES